MILPFSTQISGKPTLFPEKILSGMLKEFENNGKENFKEVPNFIYNYGEFMDYHNADSILELVDELKPKIHTIRKDNSERWKEGMNIDFFINSRRSNMFRFAPTICVWSTQTIFIEYVPTGKKMELRPIVWIDNIFFYHESISIDKKKMLKLAENDGFETIEDFFNYFNEDFEGKIIHWTDFKY